MDSQHKQASGMCRCRNLHRTALLRVNDGFLTHTSFKQPAYIWKRSGGLWVIVESAQPEGATSSTGTMSFKYILSSYGAFASSDICSWTLLLGKLDFPSKHRDSQTSICNSLINIYLHSYARGFVTEEQNANLIFLHSKDFVLRKEIFKESIFFLILS